MTNKKFFAGMLAMALVFGMMVVGCEGEPDDDPDPYVPSTREPLTGTVTVTSNVVYTYPNEVMTLTANTDGLNINNPASFSFSYQWMRDNVNITSRGSSKTYEVTSADYGKTLKVRVTYSAFSGEQFGEIVVQSPATLSLTLKWDANAGKKDTKIIIERGSNDRLWATTAANLTTTGTTITLATWLETQFKIRTEYTFVETKFYFKKDNALGSELFDLTAGSKTYTLTNVADSFGLLTGLFATEG
ncbi:MAG: hypothetical protein LBQ69_00155 [Treponema sp.]|jgi:hypothetical protein|nr:hypothetical protein [Treponema sp.]